MKHLISLSLCSLALIGCGGGSNNKLEPIKVEPNKFESVATQIEKDRVANQAGAASIAIYHNGQVVYANAVGKTRVGGSTDATSDTLFQLGSTTKVFTNLAALKQMEQGKYSMQSKLVDVLPSLAYPYEQRVDWQSIQVDWLMTHQGAFDDDYEGIDVETPLLEFMNSEYAIDNGIMNKPGEFFNYSNPNFSFLGAIIAHQSGIDYKDYMKTEVFSPLGMARTTFSRDEVIADGDYALGNYITEAGLKPVTDIGQLDNSDAILPAGNFTWSTPSQMMNMAKFILNGNGDLLSDQNHQKLIAKQVVVPSPIENHYGLGLFVQDGFVHNNSWVPMKHYSHGGNTRGYTSMFYVFPEHDLAVSILSSGYADDFTSTLVSAIDAVIDLPQTQTIPLKPIKPDHNALYAGTYSADGIVINIGVNEDKLTISVPALDLDGVNYSRTLVPVGGDTYMVTLDGEPLYFNFIAQEQGKPYTYFANRGVVATRVNAQFTETSGDVGKFLVNSKKQNHMH